MSEKLYGAAFIVLLVIGVVLALAANYFIDQLIRHEHKLGGLAVVEVNSDWIWYVAVAAVVGFFIMAWGIGKPEVGLLVVIGAFFVFCLPLAALASAASNTVEKLYSVVGHDIDLAVVKKIAGKTMDYGLFKVYVLYYDALKKLRKTVELGVEPRCLVYCPEADKTCLEKCREAYRYCSEILKLTGEQKWRCVDMYLKACGPDRLCIMYNITN